MRSIQRWWTGRQRVARLTRDAQAAGDALGKAYEEAKSLNLKGDAVQQYTGEAWDIYSWSGDALEDELHARLMQRAYRLRVPVPHRTKDSLDWEQSVAGNWRLTTEASHKLRLSIAEQIETLQRPWLNWASVAISVLSLIVAILALGFSR